MSTLTVTKLPICDFCGQPAAWDTPTASGRWAYLCEECYPLYAIPNGSISTRLVLQKHNFVGCTTAAKALLDSNVECFRVTCPLCGAEKKLEIDNLCESYVCSCHARVVIDV